MKILIIILGITLVSVQGIVQAENSEPQTTLPSKQSVSPIKHEGRGIIKAVKGDKVQLEHEAIPSLNWSAMTMWFPLRELLPSTLKVGDRVRFELEQTVAKKWIISNIALQ